MAIKEGTCVICLEKVPLDGDGNTLEHHRGKGRTQYRCGGSKKPSK